MAAYRASAVNIDTNTGNKTVSLACQAGDQILLLGINSGGTSIQFSDNCTDGHGTSGATPYYRYGVTYTKNAVNDNASIGVRHYQIGVTETVTFTVEFGAANTGGGIAVVAISGAKDPAGLGSNCIGSVVADEEHAAGTPNPTLSVATATSSFIMAWVFNGTNPGGVSVPTNFISRINAGYNTPVNGLCIATRDSGGTSTNYTWNSSSTKFAAGLMEVLNAPTPVVVQVVTPCSFTANTGTEKVVIAPQSPNSSFTVNSGTQKLESAPKPPAASFTANSGTDVVTFPIRIQAVPANFTANTGTNSFAIGALNVQAVPASFTANSGTQTPAWQIYAPSTRPEPVWGGLAQTVTMPSAIFLWQGAVVTNSGAYFQFSTGTHVKMYRWPDPTDVSTYDTVTFTSTWDLADASVCYDATHDKIYATFGSYFNGTDSMYHVVIVEINPSTLGVTLITDDPVDATYAQGTGLICTDETYLYVLTRPTNAATDCQVRKYNRSTGAYVSQRTITGYRRGASVAYDPATSRVYCLGASTTTASWVAYVPVAMTSHTVQALTTGWEVSFDSFIADGYYWALDWTSNPGRIVRISKDLATITYTTLTGGHGTNCMTYDTVNDKIITTGFNYIPGEITTFDPQTLSVVAFSHVTGNVKNMLKITRVASNNWLIVNDASPSRLMRISIALNMNGGFWARGGGDDGVGIVIQVATPGSFTSSGGTNSLGATSLQAIPASFTASASASFPVVIIQVVTPSSFTASSGTQTPAFVVYAPSTRSDLMWNGQPQTVTLTGVNLGDGWKVVGGALFNMSASSSGHSKLYKWADPTDLATYTVTTFTNTPQIDQFCQTLCYDSGSGKLYTTFGSYFNSGDSLYHCVIIEIDPTTPATWSIVVDDAISANQQNTGQIACDGTYLYLLTKPTAEDSQVRKYNRSTGAYIGQKTITGRNSGHVLLYDSVTSKLYVAGTSLPQVPWAGWVAADLSAQSSVTLTGTWTVGDDAEILGTDFWLIDEATVNPARIMRISKDLATVTAVSVTGTLGAVDGMYYDATNNKFVVVTWTANPGEIATVDATTLLAGSVSHTINNVRELNEIARIGNEWVVNTYETNSKVARITIAQTPNGAFFARGEGDGKVAIEIRSPGATLTTSAVAQDFPTFVQVQAVPASFTANSGTQKTAEAVNAVPANFTANVGSGVTVPIVLLIPHDRDYPMWGGQPQTITMAGVNLSDGYLTAKGMLFSMSIASDSKLYRWPDPTDLTTFDVVTFTDPSFNDIDNSNQSLCYDAVTDMLYIVNRSYFSGVDSLYHHVIIQCDPDTLTYSNLVDDPISAFQQSSGQVRTDGTYAYLVTHAGLGDDTQVRKYRLSDGVLMGSRVITGRVDSHPVTYDPGTNRIYMGGSTTGAAWVGWCAADLSAHDSATISGNHTIGDDSFMYGGYYWLYDEAHFGSSHIFRISTDLSSITDVTLTGAVGPVDGMMVDNGQIIATTIVTTAPCEIVVLDPTTLTTLGISRPIHGFKDINEIVRIGNEWIVTSYEPSSKIARITRILTPNGAFFAWPGGDNAVAIQIQSPGATLTASGGTNALTEKLQAIPANLTASAPPISVATSIQAPNSTFTANAATTKLAENLQAVPANATLSANPRSEIAPQSTAAVFTTSVVAPKLEWAAYAPATSSFSALAMTSGNQNTFAPPASFTTSSTVATVEISPQPVCSLFTVSAVAPSLAEGLTGVPCTVTMTGGGSLAENLQATVATVSVSAAPGRVELAPSAVGSSTFSGVSSLAESLLSVPGHVLFSAVGALAGITIQVLAVPANTSFTSPGFVLEEAIQVIPANFNSSGSVSVSTSFTVGAASVSFDAPTASVVTSITPISSLATFSTGAIQLPTGIAALATVSYSANASLPPLLVEGVPATMTHSSLAYALSSILASPAMKVTFSISVRITFIEAAISTRPHDLVSVSAEPRPTLVSALDYRGKIYSTKSNAK